MKILLILPLLFAFSYGDKVTPVKDQLTVFKQYWDFYEPNECTVEAIWVSQFDENSYSVSCLFFKKHTISSVTITGVKSYEMEKVNE